MINKPSALGVAGPPAGRFLLDNALAAVMVTPMTSVVLRGTTSLVKASGMGMMSKDLGRILATKTLVMALMLGRYLDLPPIEVKGLSRNDVSVNRTP